jgi:hypothetical protein
VWQPACLPTCLFACLFVCTAYLSAWLSAFLSSCLSDFSLFCVSVSLSTCLLLFLSACACLSAHLSFCSFAACLPTFYSVCLYFCLCVWLPACLPAYLSDFCLPACSPACLLPAYLPTGLLDWHHACLFDSLSAFPPLSYNCMLVCRPFAIPTFLLVCLPASLPPVLITCLFLCLPVAVLSWLLEYQNLIAIYFCRYVFVCKTVAMNPCLTFVFLPASLSFLIACLLSVCLSSYLIFCLPAFPKVTCVLCYLPCFQPSANSHVLPTCLTTSVPLSTGGMPCCLTCCSLLVCRLPVYVIAYLPVFLTACILVPT